MKRRANKPLSAILALLLLSSAPLVACSEQTEQPSVTDNASTEAPETEALDPNDRSAVKDSLPDSLDFEDTTITIFVASQNQFMQGVEESTGDPVDDAVLKRNTNVEERLNINLVYNYDNTANWQTIAGILSKFIMSADTTYDLYTGQQYGFTTLVSSGGFLDAYDVEYLDFSKPWWNNRYMDELSPVKDCRYFLVNDYLIDALTFTEIVCYNKVKYGTIHGDPDGLQQSVLDGTWTLDQMAQASKDAFVDLNNNAITDVDDQLGYITYQAHASVDPFMYLSDHEFSIFDEDDALVLNLNDERCVALTEKIVDFFYQPGTYFQIATGQATIATDAFINGNTLFIGQNRLTNMVKYRDMEDDFGILPYPKLNEEQENYNCLVADIACPGAIPSTSQNLDIIGAVLEALASESYRTVVPAWYETALKIKYTRDNISAQVIDIIHDASFSDFMHAYNAKLGGIGTSMRDLVNKKSTNYASTVASREKGAVKALNKLVEAFNNQE